LFNLDAELSIVKYIRYTVLTILLRYLLSTDSGG